MFYNQILHPQFCYQLITAIVGGFMAEAGVVRVDFARAGGISGLTYRTTVDSTNLDLAEAGSLRSLVDSSGVFNVPPRHPGSQTRGEQRPLQPDGGHGWRRSPSGDLRRRAPSRACTPYRLTHELVPKDCGYQLRAPRGQQKPDCSNRFHQDDEG